MSRQTTTLPRQDTATTVSSLSTSYSNLETGDSIHSTTSTLKYSKSNNNSHNHKHKSNKKKNRRHSIEHYLPACDAKTLKTLKVHYYPEEQSFSYVVAVMSAIVQSISNSLHLTFGIFLIVLFNKFGSTNLMLSYAGEDFFSYL
ncbi:hypothetical protein PVAND_013533 [Polypedilum vanderplanki]|uniref:Uncharacterized protein n=1 Tax=Polypedilum vanderplanki TaxID=319348 RepID=A0A9J6CPQ8_POLVA|nr:hypothetical protein PVAND_013533 [Polypedilum vanderplanki]